MTARLEGDRTLPQVLIHTLLTGNTARFAKEDNMNRLKYVKFRMLDFYWSHLVVDPTLRDHIRAFSITAVLRLYGEREKKWKEKETFERESLSRIS